MSTKSRRENFAVIKELIKQPQDYTFTQAVRLLERSAIAKKTSSISDEIHKSSLGTPYTLPVKETIRFRSNTSFNFPEAEILLIKEIKDENSQHHWDITVNFMGLCGSMGILPYHYTETLLKRVKEKDDSLKHFLDLFNHRVVSLFYKASTKYQLPIQYETAQQYAALSNHSNRKDSITSALLSLIGLGTESLRNRQSINDESLISYAGLLTQQVRSSTGLKDMLMSHFSVPIRVDEFIGQWQELIDDVRTRLPSFESPLGQNAILGRNCMLGKKGWFAQGKIQIVIGPLNKEQYSRFDPKSNGLQAINDLARFYVGLEQEIDYLIQINRDDTPNKISFNKDNPPIMGWNSWLGKKTSNKNTHPNEDILEVKVSSRCIHKQHSSPSIT